MKEVDYLSSDELYRLAGSPGKAKGEKLKGELLDATYEPSNLVENSSYCCLFNWSAMKYSFVSASIEKILGYNPAVFLEQGLKFMLGIIHPQDLQKLREVHHSIFTYFYNTPDEERSLLRFSYNYRVKNACDTYVHILRQSTFIGFTTDGKPGYEYVTNTDITGFSLKKNVTLAIHRLSPQGVYILCLEKEFSESGAALSQREKQVLDLVREGLTTKEIAEKLYLSVETVKTHRKHIMAKTNVGNMTGAVNRLFKGS